MFCLYRILFHRHAPVSADLVAETNGTLNFAHVLVLYSFWRVLFCLPHFRSMRYCLVIPSDFRFKVRSSLASNLVKLLIGEIVWPHTTDVMKMKTIKKEKEKNIPNRSYRWSQLPQPCVISSLEKSWLYGWYQSDGHGHASCRAMNFTGVLSSCSGGGNPVLKGFTLGF